MKENNMHHHLYQNNILRIEECSRHEKKKNHVNDVIISYDHNHNYVN